MLGISTLVAARVGLFAVCGGLVTWLWDDYKKMQQIEEEAIEEGILNTWETLFQQLGMIKYENGDRVQLIKCEKKECYDLFTLKVTGGVKVSNIEKSIDSLRIKLKAPRLEVSGEGNEIYLKNRKENVAPKYFEIKDMPNWKYEVGVDDDFNIVEWDLRKDPNMVIGGTPGCGKSALMNMLIMQIIARPLTRMVLIDLKAGVEFGPYAELNKTIRYADEEGRAKVQIVYVKSEINTRMKEIKEKGYKNYEQYLENETGCEMERLFLIIDEAGDLCSTENQSINKNLFAKKTDKKELDVIADLRDVARKGRAAGVHIIMATQRHTADSIDPTTKNCCTAIVGMRTMNEHNSTLIINRAGLERLEKREAIVILGGEETNIRTLFLDEQFLKDFIEKQPKGAWV